MKEEFREEGRDSARGMYFPFIHTGIRGDGAVGDGERYQAGTTSVVLSSARRIGLLFVLGEDEVWSKAI